VRRVTVRAGIRPHGPRLRGRRKLGRHAGKGRRGNLMG
jgi:hypothetical protein